MLLDTIPPAPSSDPMATVLPPTVSGEPVVRRMYVKKRDLDPDEPGGIGYTEGCPGCEAVIEGTPYAIGHIEDCRPRVRGKLVSVLRELQGSRRRERGKTSSWRDSLRRVSRRQRKRMPRSRRAPALTRGIHIFQLYVRPPSSTVSEKRCRE